MSPTDIFLVCATQTRTILFTPGATDLFSDFSHKLDLTENNYTISHNDTLNKLKKSLKIFINNEEYESAAIIRDKINKISN